MDHQEGFFETFDKLSLFEQWWKPFDKARAAVIIVHGSFEHSGRYSNAASHFAAAGYAVYAFDLRGHGKSPGERGVIDSFEDYLRDLGRFVERVNKREPGLPVFLLGHSLGGSIVVSFLLKHRHPYIKGMVLSAPALKISDGVPQTAKLFSPVLGNFFPKLKLAKLNAQFVSSDPEVVSNYNNDPLVYRQGLSAGSFLAFTNALNKIQPHLEDIDVPFLVLHGTKDRICDIEGSRQLFSRSRSAAKSFKFYEDFYHELFNEPGKERVFEDIVFWFDSILK